MSKLSLPLFIKVNGGTKKASEQLGIPAGTLRSYLYEEKIPRPKQAYRMMKLSRGQLDFNSIYLPVFEKQEEQKEQEERHG